MVRTYGFPGLFYEANPESSTRNIGTIDSTSNLIRPRAQAIIAGARRSPD
jgi:hypothetical protein